MNLTNRTTEELIALREADRRRIQADRDRIQAERDRARAEILRVQERARARTAKVRATKPAKPTKPAPESQPQPQPLIAREARVLAAMAGWHEKRGSLPGGKLLPPTGLELWDALQRMPWEGGKLDWTHQGDLRPAYIGLLEDLRRKGLVSESGRAYADGGGASPCYSITPLGRRSLAAWLATRKERCVPEKGHCS